MDDDEHISGMQLPRGVVEELKRLGLPLATYTLAQLQAAERGAKVDCRVFDDDHPENPLDFDDRLELTADECEDGDAQPAETQAHTVYHDGPRVRITGIATAGVGGIALPGMVGGCVAKLLETRAAAVVTRPSVLASFPCFTA